MQAVLEGLPALRFLPGNGAGSLTDVIRLYVGWGRQFIVLLDGDDEGGRQKARYKELFGSLVDGRIFTLPDVNASWHGASTESLFVEDDRLAIQRSCFPEAVEFNKTVFNRSIQELLATHRPPDIGAESKQAFQGLCEFLDGKLREA